MDAQVTEHPAQQASLIIVSPVLDDWDCVPPLLHGLDALARSVDVSVVLVDDGSAQFCDPGTLVIPATISRVDILRLGCNLGHQRAIAAGLVEITRRGDTSPVLVLDSDGEDRPEDALSLWEAHCGNPYAIIVAQRRNRLENIQFKMFYSLYKALFRILTGRVLDFGNFALLPSTAVTRLTHMVELWNHFPSSIMRSRLSVNKIPLDRQARFFGRSRMNFTALVNHGLAAIAAFNDAVFVRLLVVATVLAGMFGTLAVIVLAAQGWSLNTGESGVSTLLLLAFLGIVQAAALLAVVTFLALAQRSTPSLPPLTIAPNYITERIRVK